MERSLAHLMGHRNNRLAHIPCPIVQPALKPASRIAALFRTWFIREGNLGSQTFASPYNALESGRSGTHTYLRSFSALRFASPAPTLCSAQSMTARSTAVAPVSATACAISRSNSHSREFELIARVEALTSIHLYHVVPRGQRPRITF